MTSVVENRESVLARGVNTGNCFLPHAARRRRAGIVSCELIDHADEIIK